ncbi:MAG: 4-aminobutyrate--2-oxoglutarate transaminase [Chloroflexota bacterium]|nr:4-aminobutyrate--2-oxoglutarate transaminase [Chloroflexota bacterium]
MTTRIAPHEIASDLRARRERWLPRGLSIGSEVVVARGRGATVWDEAGKEYVDFAGGIGTMNVGHSHPVVVEAIRAQAERSTHTCIHVAAYEGYLRLAERLAEIAPGPGEKKTLLVNSGAEAVENAIKIARAATGRAAVVAFRGGFHGRTFLAVSLTGKERPYRTDIAQRAPDVYHVPYPYPYRPPAGVRPEDVVLHSLRSIEDLFATEIAAERVAAIIVEPVLGESGFIVPPRGFLTGLRSLCDRHGIVLIADEIQTGFGRTGRMFAVQHENVVPDILVMAKSLAAGLPLAAVVGRADVMDAMEPGGLGGTYGGNPVACAAALAVLDVFEREHLVERAVEIGTRLRAGLTDLQRQWPLVGDVRGLGAMVAAELVTDRTTREPAKAQTERIHDACWKGGLLLAKAGLYGNVIRLLPPLVASSDEIDRGLAILAEAVRREAAAA